MDEENKINYRFVKFIVVVGVVVLLIIGVVGVLLINNNIKNDNNSVLVENNEKLNMDDDFGEIVRTTAKKNGNWKNLPLSNNFKKKYNSKDGILVGDNFTALSYSTSSNKEQQIVILLVNHDLKYEDYYIHYTLNDKNELDDVELIKKIMTQDEDGKEVIYKSDMNEGWIGNIESLAASWRLNWDPRDYIYMTDKFSNKYRGSLIPYFDIEIKEPDNAYCDMDTYNDICDKEKRDVYLYANYEYYGDDIDEIKLVYSKKRYFKIHYEVDENNWIDDTETTELTKEEIDKLLNDKKINEK